MAGFADEINKEFLAKRNAEEQAHLAAEKAAIDARQQYVDLIHRMKIRPGEWKNGSWSEGVEHRSAFYVRCTSAEVGDFVLQMKGSGKGEIWIFTHGTAPDFADGAIGKWTKSRSRYNAGMAKWRKTV